MLSLITLKTYFVKAIKSNIKFLLWHNVCVHSAYLSIICMLCMYIYYLLIFIQSIYLFYIYPFDLLLPHHIHNLTLSSKTSSHFFLLHVVSSHHNINLFLVYIVEGYGPHVFSYSSFKMMTMMMLLLLMMMVDIFKLKTNLQFDPNKHIKDLCLVQHTNSTKKTPIAGNI